MATYRNPQSGDQPYVTAVSRIVFHGEIFSMGRIILSTLTAFLFGSVFGGLCAVRSVFGPISSDVAQRTAALKAAREVVQDLERQPDAVFSSRSICDGKIFGTQQFVHAVAKRRQEGVFYRLVQSAAVQNLWTNQICLRRDALDILDRYEVARMAAQQMVERQMLPGRVADGPALIGGGQ